MHTRLLIALLSSLSLCVFCGISNGGEHVIPKMTQMVAVGYLGNLSKMPLGFSFMTIPDRKVGLYLDFKTTVTGPADSDTEDNVSRTLAEVTWGDPLIGKDESSICFDVGLVKRLRQQFGVYAGLGYYTTQQFRRYSDSSGILGSNGKYWIKDKSKSGINITAGGLIFFNKNTLGIIGFDTTPAGINLGISWAFEMKAFKQFMDSWPGSQ